MITVPPAAAQVASSTSDGIAVAADLQPRHRAQADPAEDGVEDAGLLGVVEDLPQQHGDGRRDDDRQVGEQRVQAARRGGRRSSAPPRPAGPGSRRPAPAPRTTGCSARRSRAAGRRAPRGSCRGRRTRRAVTRLVCWTLITNDRTIGHHEKSPKTSSIGSRKTSVGQPPTRRPGRPCRGGSRAGRRRRRGPSVPGQEASSCLDLLVGVGELGVDVGVLVGEHLLHHGVEDRVHLLRVRGGLGDERLARRPRR